MPGIFKKEAGKVNNFFKKEVARPAQQFFKKGGQAEQAMRNVASGISKGAQVLGQGAKIGNQIIKGVEASPYGATLAPALGVARGIVGSVGAASKFAKDTLERAKRMDKDSQSVQFK